MMLVRCQPWKEVDTLNRQLNRLLDDAFIPTARWTNTALSFTPAVEVEETADAIALKLELPGIDVKDLDVQVTAESVSISGERQSEAKTEDKDITCSEFRYGKFQRVISLPARVQNTNTNAEYKNGVLTLTLPKQESEKNKVFKVNLS